MPVARLKPLSEKAWFATRIAARENETKLIRQTGFTEWMKKQLETLRTATQETISIVNAHPKNYTENATTKLIHRAAQIRAGFREIIQNRIATLTAYRNTLHNTKNKTTEEVVQLKQLNAELARMKALQLEMEREDKAMREKGIKNPQPK